MATVVSVEEHWALENALLDYLFAVDAMDDIDAMVACFTEDAVGDFNWLDVGK